MSSKSRFKPKVPTPNKPLMEVSAQLNFAYENVITNAAILVGADARNKKLQRASPDTPGLADAVRNTSMETSMALENLLAAVGALNIILLNGDQPTPEAAPTENTTDADPTTE